MSGATRRPAFRRTRRSLAGCALRDRGVWESICHHLVMADRQRTGREAGPTDAVIDSQSAKTTEAGGPRGRDAGKTVRAASATPWSTPMAARWSCSATLPACRTATAPSLSCAPPVGAGPSCNASSPMPPAALPRPPASPSRSSRNPRTRGVPPSTSDAARASAPSHDSAATDISPETSRPPSPPPCCSSAGRHVPAEVGNRLSGLACAVAATGEGPAGGAGGVERVPQLQQVEVRPAMPVAPSGCRSSATCDPRHLPPPGMRACPAVRPAARRPPTVEASWRRRKNLRSGAPRLLARCYSLSVAYDAHTRCCHASPARWREHRSRDEATAEAGPRYARPSDRRHSRCGRMLRPAGIAPRGRIMVAAQLKTPAPIIRAPAVSLVEPIGIEPTTS